LRYLGGRAVFRYDMWCVGRCVFYSVVS